MQRARVHVFAALFAILASGSAGVPAASADPARPTCTARVSGAMNAETACLSRIQNGAPHIVLTTRWAPGVTSDDLHLEIDVTFLDPPHYGIQSRSAVRAAAHVAHGGKAWELTQGPLSVTVLEIRKVRIGGQDLLSIDGHLDATLAPAEGSKRGAAPLDVHVRF